MINTSEKLSVESSGLHNRIMPVAILLYFQCVKDFGGFSIQIYYYCIILYACQINTSLKILHDDKWGTSQERVRPREARELVNPGQRPHTSLIIFNMKQRYNKRSNSTIGKHCLHDLRLKETHLLEISTTSKLHDLFQFRY